MNPGVTDPMEREQPPARSNLRKSAAKLLSLLNAHMSKLLAGNQEVTIAFSGGIDSTLLAAIAREHCDVKAITAGIEGCSDFANAERASEELGLTLVKMVVDEDEILDAASRIADIAGTEDRLFISFELPCFLVLESIDAGMLITGQGADELFGGYSKYLDRTKLEFGRLRENDLNKLLKATVPLENRIARQLGKRIERPYLSEAVNEYVMGLPLEMILPAGGIRKSLIRETMLAIGLSGQLATTEKKAAQYGSGVNRIIDKGWRIGETGN